MKSVLINMRMRRVWYRWYDIWKGKIICESHNLPANSYAPRVIFSPISKHSRNKSHSSLNLFINLNVCILWLFASLTPKGTVLNQIELAPRFNSAGLPSLRALPFLVHAPLKLWRHFKLKKGRVETCANSSSSELLKQMLFE